MKKFSRRDILKTSVLASAAAAVQELVPMAAAMDIAPEAAEPFLEPPLRETNDEAMKRAGRERGLLRSKPSPSGLPGRRAHGTLERPGANVVDLFVHRSGQRHCRYLKRRRKLAGAAVRDERRT